MPLCDIYGDLGSGKTILTVYIAAHEPDLPILHNLGSLRLPNARKLEPEMLMSLPEDKAMVIIDEAYTWLESLVSGSQINRYWTYILFQSRKRGLYFYITAQLPRTINIRFRELSDFTVWCAKVKGGFQYTIEKQTVNGTYMKSYQLPFAKAEKYYPLYDTMQVVKPPEMEELGMAFKLQDKEKLGPLIEEAKKAIGELPFLSRDLVETELIKKGYSPRLTKFVYMDLKKEKRLKK